MKCPFCGHEESKVTDSRTAAEMNATRRRRECLGCGHRFTTFETVDLVIQVKKRDNSYAEFQLDKLTKGIDAASRHTRISHDQVRAVASEVTAQIMEKQVREITTTEIGEMVMNKLQELDSIAYIRFACVYKRFKDVDELMNALHNVNP